jgi:hypothetical protein
VVIVSLPITIRRRRTRETACGRMDDLNRMRRPSVPLGTASDFGDKNSASVPHLIWLYTI